MTTKLILSAALVVVMVPLTVWMLLRPGGIRRHNERLLAHVAAQLGLPIRTVDGVTTVEGQIEGLRVRIHGSIHGAGTHGSVAGNQVWVETDWPCSMGTNPRIGRLRDAPWTSMLINLGIERLTPAHPGLASVAFVAGDATLSARLTETVSAALASWISQRDGAREGTSTASILDVFSGRLKDSASVVRRVEAQRAVLRTLLAAPPQHRRPPSPANGG